jgi:glycosyltransferase involved in cell wall biosynthesis
MRVAMVAACPFPANHGTPGAIRELSLYLARQGHEVHVVTYPYGEDLPIDGIQVHRTSGKPMRSRAITIGPSWDRLLDDARLIFTLARVIRRYDIQIIHSHNYEATLAGIAAKWLTGRPLIYTGVNNMADELPSYRFIRPNALARLLGKALDYTVPRGGNVLMVLSDELKTYLQDIGVPAERILVIPPGVDVDFFGGGDGMRVRERHGLTATTPLVMYTGALESFQRVDYLIQACALAQRSVPDAVTMIVGNIPNPGAKDALQRMARELGVAERVLFVDSVPLDQLPDYLAAADVAVVPRPSCPGYPIKLLNYMACAKAIVTFAGSAKAICHGYSGYVAQDHDVEDLARGIALLLTNPSVRAELGRHAQESIAGVFDWDTLARGTAVLYEQVAARRRPLDSVALGRYLKASYVPRLVEDGGAAPPHPFLRSGHLEYPSFAAGPAGA